MAERRMFSKTIIDSDDFLDMPASTQSLYFHLSMRADDDGFINNAKKVMRVVYASKNDYDLLVAKRYLLEYEDGIVVIRHWRIHNYIRKDRYNETVYVEQKDLLEIEENGAYRFRSGDQMAITPENTSTCSDGIPDGLPPVDTGKVRLGKVRLGKYDDVYQHWLLLSEKSKGFTKHKRLTEDMKRSIDKAYRIYHDTDKLKQLASRFMAIYYIKSKTEYPMKTRTLQEFYGQKAYQKMSLICEEYDDEGTQWTNRRNSIDSIKPEPKKDFFGRIVNG